MRFANSSENNNYRWQNLISAKHCQRLIQQLRRSSSFLVSFDVEGLFTNIILKKTIYIAVNIDIEKHLEIKISNRYLTELFNFPTKKKIFYLMNNFMIKMMVLQWVHICEILSNIENDELMNKLMNEWNLYLSTKIKSKIYNN